ncbi:unnamed protein product [Dibothriocephalus latus]|uniref:EPS8 spectrin-like domain-containing protein n=1 Tax=Dibothriocephalus latus TaxID=60516 RepID=A0A3P6QHP3_DIBLA|nr:unnamed protein product [Dibothriocephalus latus]
MGETIRAQHVASFLEHEGPMTNNDIMQNLRTVTRLPDANFLDCRLEIVEDEYLTIWIDSEADPSECFDLRCIDEVQGLSTKKNDQHLLVFRFRASELTNGECPDEVHIFELGTEANLKWATDTIGIAAENASDTGLLEELNRLLAEIESFEANLHDALTFQIPGSGKIDRSLWRDSLSPPSYETAVRNIQNIRTCINYTAELGDLITDPGPGELLNRLFESLWWIQKICDSNRVVQYNPNMIRSVSKPPFTDRSLSLLMRYLEPQNKAYWSSLGDAWTQPGLVVAKQKNVSEAARELSVNVGDILEGHNAVI